jgi:SRSO17 transposase
MTMNANYDYGGTVGTAHVAYAGAINALGIAVLVGKSTFDDHPEWTTDYNMLFIVADNHAPSFTVTTPFATAVADVPFAFSYDDLLAHANAVDREGDAIIFGVGGIGPGSLAINGHSAGVDSEIHPGDTMTWIADRATVGTSNGFLLRASDGIDRAISQVPLNFVTVAQPVVSVAATKATTSEVHTSTAGLGVFTFIRTGGDIAHSLKVDFSYSGTATPTADFTANDVGGSVTFAPGAKTATVTITPVDDSLADNHETVIATLAPAGYYVLAAGKSAGTVTIADNYPTVTVAATRPTASEVHTATAGLGVFTFTRTGEPIALAAGSTVRALQMFLTTRVWDHLRLRDRVQQRVAALYAPVPGAPRESGDLGVIGLIDETSVAKKGAKTPGVQRQWCGSRGKIENCVVTVHLGYAHGAFKTLLDADLYLPMSWAKDRPRCRAADIPDEVAYRPKTAIALAEVRRALGNGLPFDWLVFDEGYGKDPSFMFALDALGQTWIGEVPKNFRCWPVPPQYQSLRKEFASKKVYNVARWSLAFLSQKWRTIVCPRQTVEPTVWDVKATQVHLVHHGRPTDRTYWLLVAWNRTTDEYKYFVSNAPPRTPQDLLLHVAFRRSEIEHLFRLGKDQVGLDHFEGRSYVGLLRHMILCQLILLFLAEQTTRLNAEMAATAALPAAATLEKKTPCHAAAEDSETLPPPPTVDRDADPTASHDGTDGLLPELALCPLA